MSDAKEFVAGVDSDQRRSPTRVVFVTRRTSAQVKVVREARCRPSRSAVSRGAGHRITGNRAGGLLALLQRAAGRYRRPIAHPKSRESAVVFPRTAGVAALLSTRRGGSAGSDACSSSLWLSSPTSTSTSKPRGCSCKHRQGGCGSSISGWWHAVILLAFKVYVAARPTLIVAVAMIVAANSTPRVALANSAISG